MFAAQPDRPSSTPRAAAHHPPCQPGMLLTVRARLRYGFQRHKRGADRRRAQRRHPVLGSLWGAKPSPLPAAGRARSGLAGKPSVISRWKSRTVLTAMPSSWRIMLPARWNCASGGKGDPAGDGDVLFVGHAFSDIPGSLDGCKELIALADGYWESTESWTGVVGRGSLGGRRPQDACRAAA
jgi:hypothetical protein